MKLSDKERHIRNLLNGNKPATVVIKEMGGYITARAVHDYVLEALKLYEKQLRKKPSKLEKLSKPLEPCSCPVGWCQCSDCKWSYPV